MAFSDGDLIDFLRGELSSGEAADLRQALANDPALAARLESLRGTLGLVASLPEISPNFAKRRELDENLRAEADAEHDAEAAIAAPLAMLKLTTPAWDDAAVAQRLRARLSASQAQKSDNEEPVSLDLAILCDYWRGELGGQDAEDVEALLHADAEFAALSRSVQRTLRVLKPFTLSVTRKDRATAWDVLQRLEAERLDAPTPDICELIDSGYDQLDGDESAALRARLSQSASLRADLTALERTLVTVRRVPTLNPSAGFAARVADAIADEVTNARHLGDDARAGMRWEVLRGIATREHAEALLEDDASAITALAEQFAAFKVLPGIAVSEKFRARLAAALEREADKAQSATESMRIRSIRAMPIGRATPQLRAVKPRRMQVAFRRSTAGLRAVKAWRPLAAASLLHFLVLTASMAFIVGISTRQAGTIPSLAQADTRHFSEVSQRPTFGNHIGTDSPLVDNIKPSLGVPFVLPDLGDSLDRDEAMGLGAGASVSSGMERERFANRLRDEIRQLELLKRRSAEVDTASGGSQHGARGGEMYSMRGLDFELKAAAFPSGVAGEKLLEALHDTLWRITKSQRPDGSWGDREGADVPQTATDVPWRIESRRIENTSLAMLALLGDGFFVGDGTLHGDAIENGINYLLDHQNRIGGFVSIIERGELIPQGVLQSDAIATLALVEAYAALPTKELAMPMRRALTRIVKAQQPAGWWSYVLNDEADVVASAWAVQALEAAGKIGWRPEIAAKASERFREWLKGINTPLLTRPSERSQQSGARALATGASALAAMRGAFDDSKSGQKTVMRFLSGEYYVPSLAVTRGVGASQRQNANFTAWYFGSLAAYLETPPKDSKAYLRTLYGVLLDADGKSTFAELDVKSCELEATRGNVFVDAMAALTIENAYRLRATALVD